MEIVNICETLFNLRDEKYAVFQGKLIPSVDGENFIGVRTPVLRTLAKQLYGTGATEEFLRQLPHKWFDENQLHAFIISLEKDFGKCIAEVECFLPYIDNWATCDQLSPKIFRKHSALLLPYIKRWLNSSHTYTIRFAIGMLMQHFLEEDFLTEYPRMVASVHSDEYYVKMMQAWYFATALAKQYDSVLPYLLDRRLDRWTHNKTIQKSIESYRISPEHKTELKTLRY